MTLFWFLMVALVLGGLLVSLWLTSLWYQENRSGIWSRKVRVPALAPVSFHAPRGHGAHARSAYRVVAIGPVAPPGRGGVTALPACGRWANRLRAHRRP